MQKIVPAPVVKGDVTGFPFFFPLFFPVALGHNEKKTALHDCDILMNGVAIESNN